MSIFWKKKKKFFFCGKWIFSWKSVEPKSDRPPVSLALPTIIPKTVIFFLHLKKIDFSKKKKKLFFSKIHVFWKNKKMTSESVYIINISIKEPHLGRQGTFLSTRFLKFLSEITMANQFFLRFFRTFFFETQFSLSA